MKRVLISRRDLFVSALTMLPAFAMGEWLGTLVLGVHFDLRAVYHGFWGALIFAIMLSLLHTEQSA